MFVIVVVCLAFITAVTMVVETSLLKPQTPAPVWTSWSLLAARLSPQHLPPSLSWSSSHSLLDPCFLNAGFLSLSFLLLYWSENIPLETSLKKGMWENRGIEAFNV